MPRKRKEPTIKQILLGMPVEAGVLPIIKECDDDPTSGQLLKVLDHMVFYGTATAFEVNAVDALFHAALAREERTFDDAASLATWRQELV